MIRGHPNGNQDLGVDDTVFVEFMQQYDEKIKQIHTGGQAADVYVLKNKKRSVQNGLS